MNLGTSLHPPTNFSRYNAIDMVVVGVLLTDVRCSHGPSPNYEMGDSGLEPESSIPISILITKKTRTIDSGRIPKTVGATPIPKKATLLMSTIEERFVEQKQRQ